MHNAMSMGSRVPRLAHVLIILVLAAGCSRGIDLQPGAQGGSRPVSFRTADGFLLEGLVFGEGRDGVILSHMRPADQTSWSEFARRLASEGYQVLTFNFRGYGGSEGTQDLGLIDRDIRAAILHMREAENAAGVVLVGASMGGTASLVAAAAEEVAGVLCLSSPDHIEELNGLQAAGLVSAPKLFVAATGDTPYVQAAQELYRSSADPRDIQIVSGDAHGTDLLKGADGTSIADLIVEFVREALE